MITGFVNGDTQASSVTGTPAMSTTATSTSPVGVYPINITLGTLASANYYFTYFTNNLQIYKAPLTYTVSSPTIHQGQPIPTLTYTLTGFLNGDTASVVSGAPVLSTVATSSSPVGHYYTTGTVGTLSAHNYYFVEANGLLTILP
jgi:MBG domain-containing protein